MSNKYKIKYEKERVLLSDILPYEIPLFFSNRKFYDFLAKLNHDSTFEDKIPDFLKANLLGKKFNQQSGLWALDESPDKYTVPFNFEIRHKEDKPRVLSIVHPKNQIRVTEFYDTYKSLMIYYGNRSNFSLRKIHSVAKEEYYDDDLHIKLYSEKDDVEVASKEYKSLSSFFTYEDYSIMYKFFESHDFHKEEKKFAKMVKTDISRCFDRVYTHSFAWAIFGKKFVKDNLTTIKSSGFVSDFDLLMQKMNYNETNGIVIGPEFSRIFSEIILQKIDINIQNSLLETDLNLENRVNYSIHRYIDDYFIFYNNDADLEKIKKVLVGKLQEYNFFINDLKTQYFTKPLITNETIAKNEIKKLFADKVLIVKEDDGKITFKIDSRHLKTEIKSIAHKNNLKYENLLNYIFHLFSKKISEVGKVYKKNIKDHKGEEKKYFIKDIFNFQWNILDVIFFLYSAEPKVTQTISISSIISDILIITKDNKDEFQSLNDFIYKKIYDEVYSAIKINSNKSWSKLESIYLITILRELGAEYSLSIDFIKENLIKDAKSIKNYFEIISILFYIYDNPIYDGIRGEMIDLTKEKIKSIGINKEKDTEIFLLLIDILANPKIKSADKKDLLSLFDGSLKNADKIKIISFIKKEGLGFTDWVGFNFRNSVKQKKRLRVY